MRFGGVNPESHLASPLCRVASCQARIEAGTVRLHAHPLAGIAFFFAWGERSPRSEPDGPNGPGRAKQLNATTLSPARRVLYFREHSATPVILRQALSRFRNRSIL